MSGNARLKAQRASTPDFIALTWLIQERPYSGQKTSEERLRRVVATPYPYVIFYEVTEDDVVIVLVRHGARDPRTMPGAD